MRRIHFVQMKLGQIFIGMIHKFVPPEVEDSVFKKRKLVNFSKKPMELKKHQV